MQAYAEGFELMHHSEFELDLSEIAASGATGRSSARGCWSSCTRRSSSTGDGLDDDRPLRRGLRRGPLDDHQRRQSRTRAGAGDQRGALRRFGPRREIDFSAKVAGRLRNQFGVTPSRRSRRRRRRPTRGERAADGNPLLEGLRLRRSPDSCAIVVFGATGDLTRRKIFPALHALALRRLLPERFGVVGVARTEQTTKQWVAEMKKAVREHRARRLRRKRSGASWPRRCATSRPTSPTTRARPRRRALTSSTSSAAGGQPPLLPRRPAGAFETIVDELGERRSTEGWIRLIVEKPFGHDRASATG